MEHKGESLRSTSLNGSDGVLASKTQKKGESFVEMLKSLEKHYMNDKKKDEVILERCSKVEEYLFNYSKKRSDIEDSLYLL